MDDDMIYVMIELKITFIWWTCMYVIL